jgi:3-oxoacyl-(acyl-carrier-protein) synthase
MRADGRQDHATRNLENVGAGCELDHVIGAPRHADPGIALSASFAFGGHDAVIVFGRG